MSNSYFEKLSKKVKLRLSNPKFETWTKAKPLPALINIVNKSDDTFPKEYLHIKIDIQTLILKYTYWSLTRFNNKIPKKILKEMKIYNRLNKYKLI